MSDDESLHALPVLCQVLPDPADVPQRLADCLIAALVALEFDDQEPGLRLVNRQNVDPTDIGWVLIPFGIHTPQLAAYYFLARYPQLAAGSFISDIHASQPPVSTRAVEEPSLF